MHAPRAGPHRPTTPPLGRGQSCASPRCRDGVEEAGECLGRRREAAADAGGLQPDAADSRLAPAVHGADVKLLAEHLAKVLRDVTQEDEGLGLGLDAACTASRLIAAHTHGASGFVVLCPLLQAAHSCARFDVPDRSQRKRPWDPSRSPESQSRRRPRCGRRCTDVRTAGPQPCRSSAARKCSRLWRGRHSRSASTSARRFEKRLFRRSRRTSKNARPSAHSFGGGALPDAHLEITVRCQLLLVFPRARARSFRSFATSMSLSVKSSKLSCSQTSCS